ncbi:MAG: adenylosuccinate synthetase [Oligoflexia bacterium]|nr:adenylosuccinate synthetase [Oligoflexia bacterium]
MSGETSLAQGAGAGEVWDCDTSQMKAAKICPQFVPFEQPILAVVGLAYGDEGKGRAALDIAEVLTRITGDPKAVAMVVKVNGGSNSGHTVDGFKHHLIPAGMTNQDIDCFALGRGVVADPFRLMREVVALEKTFEDKGILGRVRQRLVVDNRCMMSDFCDRMLDVAKELLRVARGGAPRGTTAMGITPSFEHETGQSQIWFEVFQEGLDPNVHDKARARFATNMRHRIEDACLQIQSWFDKYAGTPIPAAERATLGETIGPATFARILDKLAQRDVKASSANIENGCFREDDFDLRKYLAPGAYSLDVERIIEDYWSKGLEVATSLRIEDVGERVLALSREGRFVIGEYGQAYWLHVRHGFSPDVTASRTSVAEIFDSLNIPYNSGVSGIGVVKAYSTSVGTQFVLTPLDKGSPLAEHLRPLETATTTGRTRDRAWFDAVQVGHAIRRGGIDELIINKLDALSYAGDWKDENLRICVGYRTPKGEILHAVPTSDLLRRELEPVYRDFPGWSEDLRAARSFNELPMNAKLYIAGMYKAIIDCAYYKNDRPPKLPRLRFIGVGPGKGEIISRDMPTAAELLRLAGEE